VSDPSPRPTAPPAPRAFLGTARRVAGAASLAVVLVGSPAAAILRATTVERAEAAALRRSAGSVAPVLLADAPLVGAVLGLALLGFFLPAAGSRLRGLVVAARIAALGLFLAQALDAGLLNVLLMRLRLEDVARFWNEGKAGLSLAVGLQRWVGRAVPPAVLGAAVALSLAAWAAAFLTSPFARRTRGGLVRSAAVASLALVSTAVVPADGTRFHGWAYPNVVVANLPPSTAKPYSPAYLARAARTGRGTEAVAGRGLRANVVLYVVESLSSVQSARFGGLHDFTPELDALAGRGLAPEEFHANGFTTNHGLIALLTGRVPLPPAGADFGESFAPFLDGPSLPRALAAHGYFTEFLTTADLGFTRKGEWLERIGFESIRGSRDPAFEGWPRFAFDAAPDEALVTATAARERELRRREGARPFLLVAETATSHMPFVHPVGDDHTEGSVFRYVDAQIGRLARLLEESGFFEDGLLVVVSDHRKMAPLDPDEAARWPLGAFSRVPFVALGHGLSPGRPAGPFQQADLYGSLLCLLTPSCPVAPFRGALFGDPPRPPACLLSPMSNDRELVYVRCGKDEAMVRLDGDATRVAHGRLDPALESEVLREIAVARSENVAVPWP